MALSSLSSTRIHFSFPNYNIYFSLKNTSPALVLSCDTQAAEHSPCHAVTAVSSHCPHSVLPPSRPGLPVALVGTGTAAFGELPSLPAQGAGSDSQCWGAHTSLSPALFLFSTLGSGSRFAVTLLHPQASRQEGPSSPSTCLALRAASPPVVFLSLQTPICSAACAC